MTEPDLKMEIDYSGTISPVNLNYSYVKQKEYGLVLFP